MTALELKRYYADKRDIWEDNDVGEYVRFADAQAYTQAAIAAAMRGAVKHILEMPDIPDYDESGCGVFASPPQLQVAAEIEKLIPTDATAALDTMLAKAEKRGREQALEDAACVLDHYHIDDTHTTIAAIWQDEIRAMKGGE